MSELRRRDTNTKLRTIPPLMLTYYNLAVEANLPNVLGRAAYLVNRHYNGDLRRLGLTFEGEYTSRQLRKARIKALKTVRSDTARRWLDHWESNGSLKALKYTQESWAVVRQTDRGWRSVKRVGQSVRTT